MTDPARRRKTCWWPPTSRCILLSPQDATRLPRETSDLIPSKPAPTPDGPFEDPIALTPPPKATDPWGVKRVENLLTTLTSVLSARVVVTPPGELSETDVLTQNDVDAKRVVRHIESA